MNVLDLAAVGLIALAAFGGARSGALPQIGGLAGAALGGLIGLAVLPLLHGTLTGIDPFPRAIAVLGGLLLLVGIGEGIGSALGRTGARALGEGFLGALDAVAGAVVGAAQGLLIVWLVGGLLAIGPFPRAAEAAQGSTVLRVTDAFLPAPAQVAGDVAQLLDASGLPDVFVGLEPLPVAPVQLPTDPEARAIAAGAIPSTVKVVSVACDTVLTGTGATIASGYVVTNAHVIAGARTTRVDLGSGTFDAVPVLFDPQLDVALLQVPRLPAPAMRFAADDPGRGAAGAAIGFPNGGPMTVVPAAVSRRMEAVGRDIYDSALVTRQVLELQAGIQRGDSGGPLVLQDGTIGGMVFAEARSDPRIGYALTPTEVATRIEGSIGSTTRVATGPCTG